MTQRKRIDDRTSGQIQAEESEILREKFMDPTGAKLPEIHWARRHIENLEEENARLKASIPDKVL